MKNARAGGMHAYAMRKVAELRAQGLAWHECASRLSIDTMTLFERCSKDPIYLAALSNASTIVAASEHYTMLAEVITSLERLSSTAQTRRSKRMSGMHEHT
jgi:hypothetical protein